MIQCQMRIRALSSKAKCTIQPDFKLISEFMLVLLISKFGYVIVISLLVSERKDCKIFNPSDLRLNYLDHLNLKVVKLTAFS